MLIVAAVLLIDAGGTQDGPGLCLFRRCTGGYCPGCGMTRAARQLIHGRIGAAWQDHPWLVVVAVQAVDRWRRVRPLVTRLRRWLAALDTNRVVLVVGMSDVALALVIWVIRLSNGSIPRFF